MSEGWMLAVWLLGAGVTLFAAMAWESPSDIMDVVAGTVVSLFWPLLGTVALLIVPVAIIVYCGDRFGRWMRRRRRSAAEAAP